LVAHCFREAGVVGSIPTIPIRLSTVKEKLLAAIEVAPDEVLAQTLLFVKKFLNAVENRAISREYPAILIMERVYWISAFS
jgi:hypothetical protein